MAETARENITKEILRIEKARTKKANLQPLMRWMTVSIPGIQSKLSVCYPNAYPQHPDFYKYLMVEIDPSCLKKKDRTSLVTGPFVLISLRDKLSKGIPSLKLETTAVAGNPVCQRCSFIRLNKHKCNKKKDRCLPNSTRHAVLVPYKELHHIVKKNNPWSVYKLDPNIAPLNAENNLKVEGKAFLLAFMEDKAESPGKGSDDSSGPSPGGSNGDDDRPSPQIYWLAESHNSDAILCSLMDEDDDEGPGSLCKKRKAAVQGATIPNPSEQGDTSSGAHPHAMDSFERDTTTANSVAPMELARPIMNIIPQQGTVNPKKRKKRKTSEDTAGWVPQSMRNHRRFENIMEKPSSFSIESGHGMLHLHCEIRKQLDDRLLTIQEACDVFGKWNVNSALSLSDVDLWWPVRSRIDSLPLGSPGREIENARAFLGSMQLDKVLWTDQKKDMETYAARYSPLFASLNDLVSKIQQCEENRPEEMGLSWDFLSVDVEKDMENAANTSLEKREVIANLNMPDGDNHDSEMVPSFDESDDDDGDSYHSDEGNYSPSKKPKMTAYGITTPDAFGRRITSSSDRKSAPNRFGLDTTTQSPIRAPMGYRNELLGSAQQDPAENESTEPSAPEEAETPSPHQGDMESVSEDIDAADVFTASGTGNVRSHEDDGEAIPSESEKVEREALDLPMDEREEESVVADNESVAPHLQDDEIYFSQEDETENDVDHTAKSAFAVTLVLLSCVLIFFTFSFADGTNKNGAEKTLDKAAHEMVFETCAYERGHDRGPLWTLEPSTTPTKANETLAKIEDILVDATSKRLCSIHGGEFSTKTDTSLPFFDLSFVLENITVSKRTILSSNSFTFKFGGNGTCMIGLTDEYVKKYSVVPPLCSFRYSVIAFGEYTEEAVVWFVQSMLEVLSWIVQSTEQALALLGSGFTMAVMVPVRFLKWYPMTSVSVLILAALLVDCHRLSTAMDVSAARKYMSVGCVVLSPTAFSIWKNEIESTTFSAFVSLVAALLVLDGCRRLWRLMRVSRDVALATKVTYEKLRELNAVAIGVSSLRDGVALDLNLAFGYFLDTVWLQVMETIERDSRVMKSEELIDETTVDFWQWVEVKEEDEEPLG